MYENGFWRWILINVTDVIIDRLVYMTTDLFDKVKKPNTQPENQSKEFL